MLETNSKYIEERTNGILHVIMAFARLEFNEKTPISENQDVFDAIGAGVNMLGEELENSVVTIRERESLLKEVHHRVKNNLQIISSLLNLQSMYSTDENFQALVRECRNRIVSMSIIHEMLYKSKDLSKLNTAEYVRNLCVSLQSTFYNVGDEINFEFDLDKNLELDADVMIPIGLILNEAISNCYKYAFHEKVGVIQIELKANNHIVTLKISDNGIGIDSSLELQSLNTLGMQLIHSLSEQLSGNLTIVNSNGLTIALTFQL
jgi:two-component sensor histidine kinase